MSLNIVQAKNYIRPNLVGNTVIVERVSSILNQIKENGEQAIHNYSNQFDSFEPTFIELKPFTEYELEDKLRNSIEVAAKRIEIFALKQKASLQPFTLSDDIGEFSQTIVPINRAGCYIPGGRFPLISTALMTLIPARVAGCQNRIAVSPSDHPALLAAASLAGATQFLRLGGAQAIGAFTYGFKQLKPVDIIVGPGNAYVNEAKAQVQSQVKIDGLAGPSELLVLLGKNQPLDWILLDALAQSEHDPMAVSLIISDQKLALKQLQDKLLNNELFYSLYQQQQVVLIEAQSCEEMILFSESYAPEHLMLCDDRIGAEQLTQYGSLFIGANSAVALGDYISGPNHTLPTLGNAKQSGGLNVQTFLKVLTQQKLTEKGRLLLSQQAMPLAKAEGLDFHYQSLKARLNQEI